MPINHARFVEAHRHFCLAITGVVTASDVRPAPPHTNRRPGLPKATTEHVLVRVSAALGAWNMAASRYAADDHHFEVAASAAAAPDDTQPQQLPTTAAGLTNVMDADANAKQARRLARRKSRSGRRRRHKHRRDRPHQPTLVPGVQDSEVVAPTGNSGLPAAGGVSFSLDMQRVHAVKRETDAELENARLALSSLPPEAMAKLGNKKPTKGFEFQVGMAVRGCRLLAQWCMDMCVLMIGHWLNRILEGLQTAWCTTQVEGRAHPDDQPAPLCTFSAAGTRPHQGVCQA